MSQENKKFLSMRDLSVHFHLRRGVLKAVQNVNLELESGQTIGIVGESGSGKSVMSRAIIQLNPTPPAQTLGKIALKGWDVLGLNNRQLRKVRGGMVSMIFQEPMTSLNPVFTVGQQMIAGIKTHLKLSSREAMERAAELLAKVGIPSPADRLKQYPHEFSGGMRQRVMIAMALACNPEMVIADEPTTALDVTIQAQILDLLAATIQTRGMAMILISHDLYVVSDACERICVMYAGRQVELGPTRAVFNEPLHPYAIGLKNSQPKIGEREDYLKPIPGMVPNMLMIPSGCAFHPRCARAVDLCRQEVPEFKEVAPGHWVACHLVN